RFSKRFPDIEILVTRAATQVHFPSDSQLTAPPKPWGDYAGLVERGGSHFELAHFNGNASEITILAPLTSDTLSSIGPGMADVQFIDLGTGQKIRNGPVTATADSPGDKPKNRGIRVGRQNPDPKIRTGRHLPPAAGHFDFEVYWLGSPHMAD